MNTEITDKAATVAAQGATVAPEEAPSKRGATKKKGAPKAKKGANAGAPKEAKASKKAASKSERKASVPRAETKGAKILELIGRAKGATLAEIMKASSWQSHSVRGFISSAAKKHNIAIEFSKNEAGDRAYRIAK